jgi:hypothetical protein
MESQPATFSFQLSPEMAAGRYANLLGVWHSAHEFTLDFSVTMPPQQPEDPGEPTTVPCEVVARITRSPPRLSLTSCGH